MTRKAFEAWIVEASSGKVLNLELIGTGNPFAGQYRNITIQVRWEAWQAAIAHERERCVDIIERYRVPVGNSSAGEMAAEWTMDALKEIRDEIREGE